MTMVAVSHTSMSVCVSIVGCEVLQSLIGDGAHDLSLSLSCALHFPLFPSLALFGVVGISFVIRIFLQKSLFTLILAVW